ncbi:MAG: hypothetical protein NW220_20240 [Leptolyngbyaceae cyanobacterium bins.349]|nr:hypothetical protein [Leptolyngbyaceae cyanobacterium bins.349]
MANTVRSDEVALWHKHHDNVVASLQRRLEIAKANRDTHLIELLEQEQKQIAPDRESQAGTFHHQLAILWDDFVTLVRGNSDLRVWQSVDHQGDRWWCAYNPQTGESLYTDSEAEMRMWIENTYSETH